MEISGEMFSPPGWLSSGCSERECRLCSWRFSRFTWSDLTACRFSEVPSSLNYSEIIGSFSYTKISPRVHLYMPGNCKLDVFCGQVQFIMCAPLEGRGQIVFPLLMCYCSILMGTHPLCASTQGNSSLFNGIVSPYHSCSVYLLPVSPSNEDMKE